MTVQEVRAGFLSRAEVDLIEHRLDVPDCICEALSDAYDAEEVETGIEIVQAALDRGASELELLSLRDECGAAWDVLIEAMAGSTYCAALADATDRPGMWAYRAACRATGRLAERFGVEIPRR